MKQITWSKCYNCMSVISLSMTLSYDIFSDDNDIIYHLEHPPKFSADYPLNDPQDPTYQRARQLRKDIIQLTHEAIQFFQSKREDDLESLKVIIKISRTLVDDQGIDKKGMDGHSARYTMAHTMYKTPLGHKHYPRGILGNSKTQPSYFIS